MCAVPRRWVVPSTWSTLYNITISILIVSSVVNARYGEVDLRQVPPLWKPLHLINMVFGNMVLFQ